MTYKEACDYLESYGCLLVSTGIQDVPEFSVAFGDYVFGIISEDGMRFYTNARHQVIEEFSDLSSEKDSRRFKRTIHRYIGSAIVSKSSGVRRLLARIVWGVFPHPVAMAVLGVIALLDGIYIPHGDTVVFWLFMCFMLLTTIICPYFAIFWALFFIYAVCSI